MSLHVPTLFVGLLMAFVLFGLALAVARRSLRDRPELRTWARGNWLLVAGFLALASRSAVPFWFAVLLGNGLVFAALYTLHRALHRFVLGVPLPLWHALFMVAGWVMLVLTLDAPLPTRTAWVSALLALQLAPMVRTALRHGWRAEASMRTVAGTLSLMFIALVARTLHVWTHPEDYENFFQASLGNGLTYLASFLFPLGAGFGFVMANLERLATRLNELATQDPLTGCATRTVFEQMLVHALQHARRSGEPLSLLMMDLDHFKQVNDTHGHPAGDAVLRAAASGMKERLRAADVLGRLGGEEFGVVLTDTDEAGAARVAEDLRASVQDLRVYGSAVHAPLQVTISVGACTVPAGREFNAEAAIALADRALYEAKHAGRNRVVACRAE